MNYILIMDDDPERIEWFQDTFGKQKLIVTDDPGIAYTHLKGIEFDMIFLDFNLGHPTKNGLTLVNKMNAEKLAVRSHIIIHSDDNFGIRNMKSILTEYHPSVSNIKFPELKDYLSGLLLV